MAKRYFYLIIGLLIVLSTGFQLMGEDPFLARLREKLKAFHNNYPEEKIYVQLDKPFYKPGEDIWLNAFVLNSNTHRPTSISDVLYVDLIDPKGNVASTLELQIKEGTAHGDFQLANSSPGGLYRVQAYTRWMRNFGKSAFFTKEIPVQRVLTPRLLLKLDYERESYGPGDSVTATVSITNLKNEKVAHADVEFFVKLSGTEVLRSAVPSDVEGSARINFQLPQSLSTADGLLQILVKTRGTEESISRSIPIVLNKISLQFFPEGGYHVTNVNSRIAFKALNEFGKGADISGVVVDKDNNVITQLESYHMGMGAFELNPSSGQKYFVRIETPAGNRTLIPIPDALPSGFSLNLKQETGSVIEWLVHSPTSCNVYFAGTSGGELVYSEKIVLQKGKNSINVPTEKFCTGIAVFTLFNDSGMGQCERLLFLNGKKRLSIQLTTDKQRYLPTEPVALQVRTTDSDGKPTPAKLSLAVVDDQLISFADDKQDNILSRMLLSSEVKGEIQEPGFYFDPKEAKAAKALDYLLMTQGWRRFSWKQVLDSTRIITHAPEKISHLRGILVNAQGNGFSAEVTLMELAGKKRIVKVQTTKAGHFLFRNITPTVPILLLAEKPGRITLQTNPSFSVSLNDKGGTVILPQVAQETMGLIPEEGQPIEEQLLVQSESDMTLENEVTELSEVIVTAFGAEEKNSLTGSITEVSHNSIEGLFPAPSFENQLSGRVAGIVVQPRSGSPGSQSNVMIRGTSSLSAGRSEPLFVIDGHPIGASLSPNFSNGSVVGPDDIESIHVVSSPEAVALYGSRASNGAILITTRSRLGFNYFKSSRRPPKFSTVVVQPRKLSTTREFYVPPPAKAEVRKDFRTTVYWNHTVLTDKNGEAKLSFYNNDAISSFRVISEGFSGEGMIGRAEVVYYTELPLSLDVKLPQYLGFEDVLKVPVRIKNETPATTTGVVTCALPPELSADESLVRNVSLKANSIETVWFTIKPKGVQGEFPLSIRLESGNYKDEIKHVIHVRPVGFPMKVSFSAKEMYKTVRFSILDAEKNSIKAELTAFPDVLTDLFAGAESILEEPHGCFEQVSSSTFPNMLALQFLRQSGLSKPEIEELALSYIRDGYKKLMAYEIKGGGFEWFGHPPAHEGLTAYGLLQFYEMKKVFPDVDERMMLRTRDWLMERRDGKGGFKQSSGKYGFSGASGAVTNAYLTYALSETGTTEIEREYNSALAEASNSKDMYRMALLACTAFNLGKKDDYETLIQEFRTTVRKAGFTSFKAEHSIVRSYGNSLQTEIISQWVIAMMKSPSPDLVFVENCIKEILNRRAYGQFGSTQGTTLALKALTEYARLVRDTREDGRIEVYVNNGGVADHLNYESNSRDKLVLNKFAKQLSDGEQILRVRFNETENPLPYSVDVQWYTKKPRSTDLCKVSLSTSISSPAVRVNETVRLTAVLKNKSAEGLPMTVAVIGIPAGLSPQPWQLKELQEKAVLDFYEIINGNLILYYREMAPNGEHVVNLDLKAEIPGSYLGAASSAYLYYTNEFKYWVDGNSIVIQ